MASLKLLTRSQMDNKVFDQRIAQFFDALRANDLAASMLSGAQVSVLLQHVPQGFGEFWLVEVDGHVLCSLAAFPLAGETAGVGLGFFAWQDQAEKSESAFEQIFAAASSWAKQKGQSALIGPICLNTWFPYRFRTDLDSKNYKWEPNNPKSYPEAWLRHGFKPDTHYTSHGFAGAPQFLVKTKASHQSALDAGYRFVPWQSANFVQDVVPKLYRMSLAGFADNYLFSPIDQATFTHFFMLQRENYSFDTSFLLQAPDGSDAGFVFAFIDGDEIIIKTLIVSAEHRGRQLSNALVHHALLAAAAQGVHKYVTALTISGNLSENLNTKNAVLWEHTYELFRKPI